MLKTKTVLEIKIGERTYEIHSSPDAPLGELFDAISKMRNFVIEKIKEHTEASKEGK